MTMYQHPRRNISCNTKSLSNQSPKSSIKKSISDAHMPTPITANKKVEVLKNQDSSLTPKSSEKSPEKAPSYKNVLITNLDTSITDPAHYLKFIKQKELCDSLNTDTFEIDDDDPVSCKNCYSTLKFPNSVRMTIIFKLPGEKYGRKFKNKQHVKDGNE